MSKQHWMKKARRWAEVVSCRANHAFNLRASPIVFWSEYRWVAWWVADHLARHLRNRYRVRHVTARPEAVRYAWVHITSAHLFFKDPTVLHPTNHVIASWWHGSRDNPQFAQYYSRLPEAIARLRYVVTSCGIQENELLSAGVPRDKLVRIPLGYDGEHFRPPTAEERLAVRRKWSLPADRWIVASLQRDGEEEAKWVKGPDVLLSALERIRDSIPLFVLLSAGARGFVKRGLERLGIPYVHHELPDSECRRVRDFYWAADAIAITSREEGGPEALLEGLGCGVPIVATRCGLCPEILREGENGLIVPVEDVDGIADGLSRLFSDGDLAAQFRRRGPASVCTYTWKRVAEEYHQKIYSKRP